MRNRLLAAWPLKLAALAIAFAIWASVTGERPILQDFEVPVELGIHESRSLLGTPPTIATVRLEGPVPLMRKLDPLRLSLRIDLGRAPLGEHQIPLSAADLAGVPPGVEVAFLAPDRIRLTVERRLRRELSVEPTFSGEPPEGFVLYHARVRPESMLAEGPESLMKELDRLPTQPVELARRTAPFDEMVQVIPSDSAIRLVEPREVQVRAIVDAVAIERRFDDVPVVSTGDDTEGIRPAAVSVTVSGPPALIERLLPGQIRANVVADETAGGGRPTPVDVSLVDLAQEQLVRLRVRSVEPEQVTVRPRRST